MNWDGMTGNVREMEKSYERWLNDRQAEAEERKEEKEKEKEK
jgi:hypothetical protein